MHMHVVDNTEEIFTPQKPLTRRALQHLGHAYEPLSTADNAVDIAMLFTPDRRVRRVVFALSSALTLSAAYVMKNHDRQGCPTCLSRMPSDGDEQAQAHAAALELAHDFMDPERAAHYAMFAGLLAAKAIGRNLGRPGQAASDIVKTGFYLTRGRVLRLHNRLQPWCHLCHPYSDKDDSQEVLIFEDDLDAPAGDAEESDVR